MEIAEEATEERKPIVRARVDDVTEGYEFQVEENLQLVKPSWFTSLFDDEDQGPHKARMASSAPGYK